MKRFSFFLFLLAAPAAFAGSQEDCTAFARNLSSRAMQIVKDGGKSDAQKKEKLYALFYEVVDTDWIGQYVLGRFWKTASTAEQKEYLSAYRTYMSRNYIGKLKQEDFDSFTNIEINAVMPRPDDTFEAKAALKQKDDDDVSIHLLLDAKSQCHIHDIKVEGVSLIANQHSEFTSLASSAGVQGIVAALNKQIRNLQNGN